MFNQVTRLLLCAATITMLGASGFQAIKNADEIDSEKALSKSAQAVSNSTTIAFNYLHEKTSSPDVLHSLFMDAEIEKDIDTAQLKVNQKLTNNTNEIVNNNVTRYFIGKDNGKQLILEGSDKISASAEKDSSDSV